MIRKGKGYYKYPTYLNMATGVTGVLFPPNCCHKDIFNDTLFMKLTPTNDDIWFWAQACLKGTKTSVINDPIDLLQNIPGSQNVALGKINNFGPKLFWKQFNNILKHYPSLKQLLLKELKVIKDEL